MGIMLISISKLDVAGYAALFRDKRCQIFDTRKKKLGEIVGLYKCSMLHNHVLELSRRPLVHLSDLP